MKECKIYKCEICGESYDNKDDAEKCESFPQEDTYGIRVGDIVRLFDFKTGQTYAADIVGLYLHASPDDESHFVTCHAEYEDYRRGEEVTETAILPICAINPINKIGGYK